MTRNRQRFYLSIYLSLCQSPEYYSLQVIDRPRPRTSDDTLTHHGGGFVIVSPAAFQFVGRRPRPLSHHPLIKSIQWFGLIVVGRNGKVTKSYIPKCGERGFRTLMRPEAALRSSALLYLRHYIIPQTNLMSVIFYYSINSSIRRCDDCCDDAMTSCLPCRN